MGVKSLPPVKIGRLGRHRYNTLYSLKMMNDSVHDIYIDSLFFPNNNASFVHKFYKSIVILCSNFIREVPILIVFSA